MGLQALLGEAARPAPAPGAARAIRRGAVSARSTSRGSSPTPTSRGFSSTKTRSTSSPNRSASAACCSRSCFGRDGDGYLIVAGERRWRAAQRARLHTIPAIVREIDEFDHRRDCALIENIQRQDLNPLEEAEGYRQLIQRHGHTQDDVGRIVHKSRSHVANLLRLLDLPEFVRQSLLQGDISMGHARAVATAADPEDLTREIIAKGLSVRQAEERARRERPAGPRRRHRPRQRPQRRQGRRCRPRRARAPARRHPRAEGPGHAQGAGRRRSPRIIRASISST